MSIVYQLKNLVAELECRGSFSQSDHDRIRMVVSRTIPVIEQLVEALEVAMAYVDDAAGFPEQFKPGVVKRHASQVREAICLAESQS